jgi:cobalt-zinc-cadmium efflux system outer membrane protein
VRVAADASDLARRAEVAARERFSAGASSRLDLNAAAVERSRAEREMLRAEQASVAAASALGLLLGADRGPVVPEGDLEGWMGRARAEPDAASGRERPELIAARQELAAARAERELAARSVIPDLRLGATYAREEGAHIAQGTVGFALPLFRRNQGERGVTAAQVSRAEAGVAAALLRVGEEEKLARARLTAARRGVALFSEGALAGARENAALATEGYEAGKLGFLELLVARRDALATREAYIDALEELNAAEVQLMRASASGSWTHREPIPKNAPKHEGPAS